MLHIDYNPMYDNLGDDSDSDSSGPTVPEQMVNDRFLCLKCGESPCIWTANKDEFLNRINDVYDTDDDISNRQKRKSAYKLFIYIKYGTLGKGNRVELSDCVLREVRKMFPDSTDDYMGYKSS